ncbi:iron complex transport system permease protein [Tranquillimonas rosea]|uniref:Iron complex transport system permease protein n=1 Tax=Tranquillimonas rosea TaxID=641238 RepID=A0A1H9SRI2_9RHOB|nr:iron ABC transporter permease [Tranquillimonas rosea]SER87620.1 iron complex transport system permease protein [Tranquillimonas rosea]
MSALAFEAAGPIHTRAAGDRSRLARAVTVALAVLLAGAILCSLAIGAAGTSLWSVLAALARGESVPLADSVVLWQIRAPRTLMGIGVGAALAVSGALMQGLFRNPLADPGIVGVGAGAGLGAIAAIVMGAALPAMIRETLGYYLVPVAAFLGGWVSTLVLYRVATRRGRTSVAMMLLAGIALGALAGALSGILVYIADDAQLRDLTFWGLGSLAGATWSKVLTGLPIMLPALVAAPFLARGLNGLTLGEAAAFHLGIHVQRVKNVAILAVAAATGAAVALSGGIGFVGIVVPHLLRLMSGPDHRYLLVNSALLGAALLLVADIVSRTVIAPAELPIGIVTAVLGGPVFLWILFRQRGVLDL